jgi:hypothetical protein
MKEFLEGRRFGFALRPLLGHIALGSAIAVLILDLMAWMGWGVRDTNGFVVAAAWLAVATAVFAALATITALVESTDAAEEDRSLARLDVLAALVAVLLYVTSGRRPRRRRCLTGRGRVGLRRSHRPPRRWRDRRDAVLESGMGRARRGRVRAPPAPEAA